MWRVKKRTRFGIVSEEDFGSGHIVFEAKTSGTSRVIFKNNKTLKRAVLQLDYILPAIAKDLINENNFKFIVKDKVLKFEVTRQNVIIDYDIPNKECDIQIKDFNNAFKFFDLLEDQKENHGKIEVEFSFPGSQKRYKANLGSELTIEEDFLDEISLTKNFLSLIDDLGIDSKLNQILDYMLENRHIINFIGDLLNRKEKSLNIKFKPNENEDLLNSNYIVSLVAVGSFGSTYFAYSTYMKGRFKRNDISENEYVIEFDADDIKLMSNDLFENTKFEEVKTKLESFNSRSVQFLESSFSEEVLDLGFMQKLNPEH